MDSKLMFLGGEPNMREDDFMRTQNANREALHSIVKGFGLDNTNFIITGCIATNTGGTLYDVTAGYIFLDGEVIQVDAITAHNKINSFIQYKKSVTYEAGGDKVYINGINRQTWEKARGTLEDIAAVTTLDALNGARLESIIGTPTGTVRMYTGSLTKFDGTGLGLEEWNGWALCNGSNGTADLRSRFIVGYDPTDVDYDTIGKTGGEKTHTLIEAELPTITPSVTDAGHSHDYDKAIDGPFNAGVTGATTLEAVTPTASSTETTGITVDSFGSDAPHENRPPFYTLALVQKL